MKLSRLAAYHWYRTHVLRAAALALCMLAFAACANNPTSSSVVPSPSPSPSPSASPVSEFGPCAVVGGYHHATVNRNGKSVTLTAAGGWHFDERPTVEIVAIFAGESDPAQPDTASCPQFTQANAWDLSPDGECRTFADNINGRVVQVACRRPIDEGLSIKTLVPDPNNPARSITIESHWNVGN